MAALLFLMAPSGCKRQAGADDGGEIDSKPIVTRDPKAEPPAVVFPDQLKTDDVAVNEFIRNALERCQKGEYVKFRQLFGVAYEPPGEAQFDRVWKGVKQISIAHIIIDDPRRQPPDYYVHVIIQLRQADRYSRTERQAVVRVFKEGDEWQMAPAPSEIQGEILFAATQPGSGWSATTRPTKRHPASRPTVSDTLPAH